VGKTALALSLASQLPLEIVNADSRQVYRHMDIGTSKPTLSERSLIRHHVYDVADPDEGLSLALYHALANAAIAEISTRGRVALVVGGSGQYVWSLVEGWNVPGVPPDAEFRRRLEAEAKERGYAALHAQLVQVDPEAALSIQPSNVRRVIRALELYYATGERPSVLLRQRASDRRALVLGLTMERQLLLGRADSRIDTMVGLGFPEEVRTLLSLGYGPELPAMSSIGYREMIEYVTGAIELQAAVTRIRMQTRRLVRRQYTWFRPTDERITWLDATSGTALPAAIEMIEDFLG